MDIEDQGLKLLVRRLIRDACRLQFDTNIRAPQTFIDRFSKLHKLNTDCISAWAGVGTETKYA